MKAVFARGPAWTLIPADEEAERLVASLKPGEGVTVEARRARNVAFHRKFFSLLRLGFDVWEPEQVRVWRGEPLRKDFDSFRRDILILAGYFDSHFGVDGSVSLVARSISFSACDEHAFSELYGKVLDVLWDRILRHGGYGSQQEVDDVVEELLAYC